MSFNYKSDIKYIVLEFASGIVFGTTFLIIVFYSQVFENNSIAGYIISFFGGLSLAFFFPVFLFGIIGAVKNKQTDRILMAIVYSICFWILSLIVAGFFANFLSWGIFFIMLAAIVYGFNLGLRHNFEPPQLEEL